MDARWSAGHPQLHAANNPGVAPRNVKQDICFDNAAVVMDRNLDPVLLFWPNRAPKEDSLHATALKALELGLGRDSSKV